jgi:hypothetical protein
MSRSVKSVVQVRAVRQDKLMEDFSKIRGVEMSLRSIQFRGVEDINEKLEELTKQGIPCGVMLSRCYLGEIWIVV